MDDDTDPDYEGNQSDDGDDDDITLDDVVDTILDILDSFGPQIIITPELERMLNPSPEPQVA